MVCSTTFLFWAVSWFNREMLSRGSFKADMVNCANAWISRMALTPMYWGRKIDVGHSHHGKLWWTHHLDLIAGRLWEICSKNVCVYIYIYRYGLRGKETPGCIGPFTHRADKAQIGSTYPYPLFGSRKGACCVKLLLFLSIQYLVVTWQTS